MFKLGADERTRKNERRAMANTRAVFLLTYWLACTDNLAEELVNSVRKGVLRMDGGGAMVALSGWVVKSAGVAGR